MIRDMAISTITIGGLLTGCLASSILIAGEFERQTVLAVLCKPVSSIFYFRKISGNFSSNLHVSSFSRHCAGSGVNN
ncbi:MAG: hypothetical protein SCABRO_01273 [Candidatus Scalindua brodae]|uniref:Uncharacterized protein n=1 Tax=Candidatus Scalindua brodae TaxID=237368 RepID=A0A0B0EJZ2_9BACT|nr:MAG: hypothetical protein SCABRO_01273 [Candidatus Scalindua brodae]